MSLSRVDTGNSALSHQSNPSPGELNLATSTGQTDKLAVAVKPTAEADAELATLLLSLIHI